MLKVEGSSDAADSTPPLAATAGTCRIAWGISGVQFSIQRVSDEINFQAERVTEFSRAAQPAYRRRQAPPTTVTQLV
jgi:hypothetical protein